jgi:dihydrofolate reductase
MSEIRVAVIVAVAQNRVIGIDNQLPWHLPNDLKHFKQLTLGKPILMGRKTFESIGKPLPGRTNIVLTREADFHAEGIHVAHSIEEALALARAQCAVQGSDELMVIGGDRIYEQCLPLADRLYLTQVHAQVAGDAYFPDVDFSEWQEMAREDFPAQAPNQYDYSFVVLDRRTGPITP